MDWYIFKDGLLVNVIHADETFVKKYCAERGYTYELRQEEEVKEEEPTEDTSLSVWDELDAAYQEGVNSV